MQQPEESLPPDWEQFWENYRELARHAFPNPDRIGCPPIEALRQLALDRKSVSMDDPRISHCAECSPCFDYVQRLREEAQRNE
jgi:hypothetical protein